jgi:hypothetical protein
MGPGDSASTPTGSRAGREHTTDSAGRARPARMRARLVRRSRPREHATRRKPAITATTTSCFALKVSMRLAVHTDTWSTGASSAASPWSRGQRGMATRASRLSW